MTTNNNQEQDFSSPYWKSLVDFAPSAAYYSSPSGRSFGEQSPSRQRYFETSFGDMYNRYLGELGTMMRAGKDPYDLTWQDYLDPAEGSDRTTPFSSAYASMSPSMRGEYTSPYAPRTRQIYF